MAFILVGSLEENPLAVKLLDNRLYMSPDSHMKNLNNSNKPA